MERKHLESAATNYSYLRGLFSIPLGIVFILAGLANLEWGPFSQTWVFVIALLLAGVSCLLIARYYNENFGRVTLSKRQKIRAAVATVFSVAVVVGGVQTDWSFDLPINGTAAALALMMLVYYALTVGLRAHHMIIWGALLLVGLLPVWGDVGPDSKTNVAFLIMGAATVATGLLDHGALKRTFGSSSLNLENGNVGA